MSRRVLWILAAVVVVVVGLVVIRHGSAPATASSHGRGGGAPAVAVQAATAQYGNMDTYLTLVGTVAPVTELNVVAQISEPVVSLPVKLGAVVHSGEVVAKLDSSSLDAQLASAQAALQQAQAHLNQVEQGSTPQQVQAAQASVNEAQANLTSKIAVDQAALVKAQKALTAEQSVYAAALKAYQAETPVTPSLVTMAQEQQTLAEDKATLQADQQAVVEAKAQLKADQNSGQQTVQAAQAQYQVTAAPTETSVVDQAQASVAQAEAQVRSIQVQLGETVIHSPLNGVVTSLPAAVGTLAGSSSPLMTIQSSEPQINATVPQEQVDQVKAGDPAQVVLGVGGTPIPAHVTLVNPAGNTSTLTFPIVLVPDSPAAQLMPGQSVQVQLRTGNLQHALLIPAGALQPISGQNEVYTIQNGVAHLQSVKIQAQSNSQVAVASGLTAGEQVVVGPQEYLSSGARVTVISGQNGGGGAAPAAGAKTPAKSS